MMDGISARACIEFVLTAFLVIAILRKHKHNN